MKPLVNFIGAGKVGQTLGYLLVKYRLARIGAVCNQSENSALAAIQVMGEGKYYEKISALPAAQLTFITAPDDLITVLCEQLHQNPFLQKNSIVLHCSGALSSEILAIMREKACYIASAHPLRSFAKPNLRTVEQFNASYCALEGDKPAISTLYFLFKALGFIPFEINPEKKSLYHAAAVLSSNYIVTLAQQALSCMKESGLENEIALPMILSLMQSTLSNLEQSASPEKSLTGPLQRGDLKTLMNHCKAFSHPEQRDLYALLGKATLPLTQHDADKKEKILKALGLSQRPQHLKEEKE